MSLSILEDRKTDQTRAVEALLQPEFESVDCYRYSPYVIRLCIVDEKFRQLSQVQRHELVEPWLQRLPQDVQDDLIFVLLLAPGEAHDLRYSQRYLEFMDPSPSFLDEN